MDREEGLKKLRGKILQRGPVKGTDSEIEGMLTDTYA